MTSYGAALRQGDVGGKTPSPSAAQMSQNAPSSILVPQFSGTRLTLGGAADLYTISTRLFPSQLDLNPGTRAISFSKVAMTYFRQFSLQNDSVSSSSDASLYVDTFNTDSESRVTSTSETSSSSSSMSESSVNSENLANQLRESPWVTSTTTEENVYTADNQSMTNLIKNNNTSNADLCLFKVSYILQGGK